MWVNIPDVKPNAKNAFWLYYGSNDAKALDLMTASDADLLRRLNTVTDDGYLTNAGALVFVGRPTAALDYLRRQLLK